MRPFEKFLGLEVAKANFSSSIVRALQQIPGIRSVTFTGSFVEKEGLAGISDIDVVVVVEPLSQTSFNAIRAAMASISPAELGLPEHRLIINDTFGPLKLDTPGTVVLHLMIYDAACHREHVLKSPFTCLDWERSPYYVGSSLRAIYPVLALQPRQFWEVRRSLTNYIEDIAAGTISFRRHHFDGATRSETLERLPLDRRHQGEYAFHIVRNLIGNYSKLILKQNHHLNETALLDFWSHHLPGCREFSDWFAKLCDIKQARQSDFPADTPDRTREFLAAFARVLQEIWSVRATRHLFIRHAPTELNDGTFLGQRRDPPISVAPGPLAATPPKVFVSPALRCRQTAAALAPDATIEIDDRLHEIDYGKAEGLRFSELSDLYPEISTGWNQGEDPAFPLGENTAAVAARLDSFLNELPLQPSLVVTHNVTLRCLLGSCLGLSPSCWHRIPVAHLEQFEVLRLNGASYLNLLPVQIAGISDALAGHIS